MVVMDYCGHSKSSAWCLWIWFITCLRIWFINHSYSRESRYSYLRQNWTNLKWGDFLEVGNLFGSLTTIIFAISANWLIFNIPTSCLSSCACMEITSWHLGYWQYKSVGKRLKLNWGGWNWGWNLKKVEIKLVLLTVKYFLRDYMLCITVPI